MENSSSRKLLFTAITGLLLALLANIVFNLFTGRKEVSGWVENLNLNYLAASVIGIIIVSLLVAYLHHKYTEKAEKEKELLTKNIDPDVKKLFDSLKERYQKRYESKLDERFEITLEVSEDWDGNKTQTFTERYDKDAKISEAFPRLKELFDKKDGLLIIGEPGAGKTVLLLKIALNLLEKTDLANKEAFPMIFNLASWNADYKDFGEWLTAMLVSSNGLSKDFAESLLREKCIILFLDGLDELARNEPEAEADQKRAACLESLNKYLDGEKNVICCRIDEFAAMQKNTAQDAPVSAKVEVLNLTEAEVLNALEHAQNHADTKHHASAKNLSELIAKEENAALRKIICIPFYFTLALEVFYKRLPEKINLPNNEEKLKTYLIEIYIKRKLDKTPNPNNFERKKTGEWFKWLAKLMEDYQIISFELADLQPIDLPNKSMFSFLGSVFITLIFFLIYINFVGFEIVFKLSLATFLVAYFYFNVFDLNIFKDLSKNKIVRYDVLKFLKLFAICFFIIEFLVLLIWFNNRDLDLTDGIGIGFLSALLLWIFLLAIRIHKYKKYNNFSYLQNNYQRIFAHFLVNTVLSILLIIILIILLTINSLDNIQLGDSCLLAQIIILVWVLRFLANISLLWHFILRFCLYFEGAMPLKYATFLDYAAEARILEKDGGQWRFRHQNLQEYFAKLEN